MSHASPRRSGKAGLAGSPPLARAPVEHRSGTAPIAALLLCLVGVGSSPSSFDIPAAASQATQRSFGFDVGEERRYILGPPEALRPGEGATWLIRLDRLRPNGEAVFVLEHRRTGPDQQAGTPAYGEELNAEMEAELVVNGHGFPMTVSLDVRRSVYGYPDDQFYVRYQFDGRSLQKHVDTFGKRWDIALPIPAHPKLSKSVPAGLYVFLPDAFHCLGYRSSVMRISPMGPPQPTAGSLHQPAGALPRVDREALPCEPNTDLGFLNPGLLSLVWPALIEAAGNEDFLFFTPTGADLFPGPRVSGNVGGIGGTGPVGGGRIDRARDPHRYYASSRIQVVDHTQLHLRGRTFDAVVAKISGLQGVVYVGEDNKVLLIDIAGTGLIDSMASNAIRSGNVDIDSVGFGERRVRLMFPSEY